MPGLRIRKRIGLIKESLPFLFVVLLLSAYPVINLYYAALNFMNGYWSYGILCLLGSFACLWLFSPMAVGNWIQLCMVWQRPSCDFYGLDLVLTKSLRLMRLFRSPAAESILNPFLAVIKTYEGHYGDAEHLYRAILQEAENGRWRGAPQFALYECVISSLYIRQQRFEEAQAELDKAFKRLGDFEMVSEQNIAFVMLQRAAFRFEIADLSKASEDLEVVLKTVENYKSSGSVSNLSAVRLKASAYTFAATIFLQAGEFDRGMKYRAALFKVIAEVPDAVTPFSVKGLNGLANECSRIRHLEDAEKLLSLSYDLMRVVPGHPDSQETLEQFRQLLVDSGREQEVGDMLSWVRALPNKSDDS